MCIVVCTTPPSLLRSGYNVPRPTQPRPELHVFQKDGAEYVAGVDVSQENEFRGISLYSDFQKLKRIFRSSKDWKFFQCLKTNLLTAPSKVQLLEDPNNPIHFCLAPPTDLLRGVFDAQLEQFEGHFQTVTIAGKADVDEDEDSEDDLYLSLLGSGPANVYVMALIDAIIEYREADDDAERCMTLYHYAELYQQGNKQLQQTRTLATLNARYRLVSAFQRFQNKCLAADDLDGAVAMDSEARVLIYLPMWRLIQTSSLFPRARQCTLEEITKAMEEFEDAEEEKSDDDHKPSIHDLVRVGSFIKQDRKFNSLSELISSLPDYENDSDCESDPEATIQSDDEVKRNVPIP